MSTMKKLLMFAVLTLGVAVPSIAMATTAADEGGDGSWCCPCCGG